ncbi:MAG: hypothetical protein MUE85_01210 [Microscillaceae bacterium]|jgi:hypothetical protein|nr:hypothetical protein [Microscillaceae bacterium]
MSESIEFNHWISQIIDTIEIHTETKPADSSRLAVVQAYKSLYLLKHYFENKTELAKNILQGNTSFGFDED